MSIKLGTLGIKPPYSKVYLGNLLKYQASGGNFVETEFTTGIFPTNWTEITTAEYTSTDLYGEWKIWANRYTASQWAKFYIIYAFDGDSSTKWHGGVSSTSGNAEMGIILPTNTAIKFTKATLTSKSGVYGADLYGKNETTGEWELLWDGGSNTTTTTITNAGDTYYTEFKFIFSYTGTSTNSYVDEFQVNEGVIKHIFY